MEALRVLHTCLVPLFLIDLARTDPLHAATVQKYARSRHAGRPSADNRRFSQHACTHAGPAGIHFAHKLKRAGYDNPVVLEAEQRPGGKTHTKSFEPYGSVRHEVCGAIMAHLDVRADALT